MALYDTLKVVMSREHSDRVAPVFCVFLTHWDCIYLAEEGARSATISVRFAILKLFSLTGTVSTSPNLAKARARRASNDCRATRSLFT